MKFKVCDTHFPAAWVGVEGLNLLRLDSRYYSPQYLKDDELLNSELFEKKNMGQMAALVKDGPGGWAFKANEYTTDGVPVIRASDLVNGLDLSNTVYMTEEKHQELKQSECLPGDLVISVRGTPGRAAIIPNSVKKANLNAAVVRVRLKEKWLKSGQFITAFLNSIFGRRVTERIANGAVQNNINLTEVRSIPVPIPDSRIRDYIGLKVELAEKCREEATKNRNIVNELFESILHERKFHSYNAQTRFVPPDDLTTEWLNSNFYRQIYKDLLIDLDTNGVPLVPLGEYGVCSRQKERPKGDIFYIEISDIDNFNGIISGGRNCSPENTPNNAQRTIKKSDILMSTRRPDRGAVAYVEDNIDNAFCSVFLAKIQTHEKSHSRFIHEYLRTNTAKLFIGQRCTVTTYPVISEDDIETIPVPVVSPELIAEISEASKKASLYKKFADQLVVEAKSNVEALIEGKLDTDAILSGKLKAPTWEDIEKELEGI